MSIHSTLKELRKLMSKFIDDIESAIQNIHIAHGIDDAALSKKVADAVTANVAPLQTEVTDLQGKVAELQKALQDTVAAINSGDTAAAQTIASTAANAATGGSTGAGADAGAGTGQ